MKTIHEEALERGVHPECFKAGPTGACEPCKRKVIDIFAERYDHVPADLVKSKIITDLLNEKSYNLD
jgi:hypothetical protein